MIVNIQTIRGVVNDVKVGAKFTKNFGSNPVGGSVGRIHDDFHSFHRQIAGKSILQKVDIPAVNVVNAGSLAHIFRFRQQFIEFIPENHGFDFVLLLIGQLEAIGIEDFQAVVLIGIVRCGNDDAGVGPHALSDKSDAGGWQDADQIRITAHGSNAGFQRALQHIAR